MTTTTFDMAKFMGLMKQDPSFRGFDFDAYQKQLTKLLAEHGPALDALAAHEDELFAERARSYKHDDPDKLRQAFFDRELRATGVDWQRFHAGKQDEHEAVTRYLTKHGSKLTAGDLARRKAARDDNSASSQENITKRDADLAETLHGDQIRTFVTQRAARYAELRDAATGNNVMGAISAMLAGGFLSFGAKGASAATHAQSAGGNIVTAILAGVGAIGGLPVVGDIAVAILAFIFVVALIFGEAHILTAIINRTTSGLLLEDFYQLHGDPPIVPMTVTSLYDGVTEISANFQYSYNGELAIFIAYYYQEGDHGFVGVNGAYRARLAPLAGSPAGSTGLAPGSHIYIGHAIEKLGGTFIKADITSDPSSEAFYQRGFSDSDSSASAGPIRVQARLSEYTHWSVGAKNVFELAVITNTTQQG